MEGDRCPASKDGCNKTASLLLIELLCLNQWIKRLQPRHTRTDSAGIWWFLFVAVPSYCA